MLLVGIFFLLIHVTSSIGKNITEYCYSTYTRSEPSVDVAFAANGIRARLKEFPHLTAIGWTQDTGSIFWGCGGSLVTTKFVLTAGHCSYRFQNGESVAANVARMGTIDLDLSEVHGGRHPNLDITSKEQFAQQYKIIRVIPYPEYKSSRRYHDIALMELENHVTVNEYVAPICLWNDKRDVFSELAASGFGETEFGSGTSPNLVKVSLTRSEFDECKELYGGRPDRKLPDGLIGDQHLCANDKTDAQMDTCQGDSGGPLEFKILSKPADTWIKTPVLIGLTSFGQAGCGNSAPAVYTRVASYIDWIEKETNENLSLERCLENYSSHREDSIPQFENQNLPSYVRVNKCPGLIIHAKFVLTSTYCTAETGFVKTSDDQEINIETVYENNGFTLLRLENEISFTKRTAKEVLNIAVTGSLPYVYKVGPTCLTPEPAPEINPYFRSYRTIHGKYLDQAFKFDQDVYNTSECKAFLRTSGPEFECLGGKWFQPDSCEVERFSFGVRDDLFPDPEVFHGPIPIVAGYVAEQHNCGPVLMKKITNGDFEWINSVVFG